MKSLTNKLSRFAYFRTVTREERLGYIDRIRDAAPLGEEQANAAYLEAREEISKRPRDFLKILTFILLIVGIIGYIFTIVQDVILLTASGSLNQWLNLFLMISVVFDLGEYVDLISVFLLVCLIVGVSTKKMELKEYKYHYAVLSIYLACFIACVVLAVILGAMSNSLF